MDLQKEGHTGSLQGLDDVQKYMVFRQQRIVDMKEITWPAQMPKDGLSDLFPNLVGALGGTAR
jgi:hypothetical protein